jgi:hypothetical protein
MHFYVVVDLASTAQTIAGWVVHLCLQGRGLPQQCVVGRLRSHRVAVEAW